MFLRGLFWMSRRAGTECPVCKTTLQVPAGATAGDRSAIDCERCGRFEISGTAIAMLEAGDWTEMERAILSYYVRQQDDGSTAYVLTSEPLQLIRRGELKLPTPPQQAARLLRYVAENVTSSGKPLSQLDAGVVATVGAFDQDALGRLTMGLIASGSLRGRDVSSFSGTAFRELEPTITGWTVLVDEEKRESEVGASIISRAGNAAAIFLGYRRADTGDAAGRMFDVLSSLAGRGRVFKDVDSMPLGVDFRAHVRHVLNQCKTFLALIGPSWTQSKDVIGNRRLLDPDDLVRIEIEVALENGLNVIPVLINGAAMPSENDLPDSLRALCGLNAAIIRQDPDFHRDMQRLAGALGLQKLTLEREAPPKRSQPSAPQNKAMSGRLTFDYSSFDGRFVLGDGNCLFETQWYKSSDKDIALMRDPPSIDGIAVAPGATQISDVKDAASLDFTSRIRRAALGGIAVLRNTYGVYAAVKIISITDDTRGASRDQLTIEYVIQSDGSTSFERVAP
ncbi:MAG: TIR domain-containing protein [Verrucomicrobiaceae bacterium]|nr:MAG: TIR domain-containing protein [Verrucomicrobiaceae bacterium]